MKTASAMAMEAFKWWDHVPDLCDFQQLSDIKRHHDGYFYDEATVRFYGSRNIHVAAPGVTVELQTNAPTGYPRYAVTVWVWDNKDLYPNTITKCHTLREARKLAVELSTNWPTKVKS
jgi:hypothetical protein